MVVPLGGPPVGVENLKPYIKYPSFHSEYLIAITPHVLADMHHSRCYVFFLYRTSGQSYRYHH